MYRQNRLKFVINADVIYRDYLGLKVQQVLGLKTNLNFFKL